MSLNKSLDRFFDEIRREAKRNAEFADRLDAVMRAHASRRDVPEEVQAQVAPEAGRTRKPGSPASSRPVAAATPAAQGLNPAGLYKREGEAGLRAALAEQELSALRALVAEHNLDPGGVTSVLTRDELAAHIVTQAQRRAERDEKMFDY